MQRALYFLLNPTGGKGACSSPGLSVLLIFILIPSFLLTTAVCGLIYLSIRCFRRGQIAYGVVALIAALGPFLLFATRLVQASAADREHANCLAGLAKTGPVANYPNILVSRNGLLLHDSAARLMLVAGFREVDLIGSVPYDGDEPYTETMTLTPIGDCREKLEAWVARGASMSDFFMSGLRQCVNSIKGDPNSILEKNSVVILLRGRATTLSRATEGRWDAYTICKGGNSRELRIKDGRGDILVDYVEDPVAQRPIFPLLVSWIGFEMTRPTVTYLSDAESVLRNLKTGQP